MKTIRENLYEGVSEFIEPLLGKRFWVFATDDHDEWGGLQDIQATFDTLEESESYLQELNKMDRIYIFDREQNKIIHKK